jgi:TrmH family RNA methyltransferase
MCITGHFLMEVISSRQNTLVKQLKKLVDSKKVRNEQGQIVAEGTHLLEIQLAAGIEPALIVISQRCINHPEISSLVERLPSSRLVVLMDSIFDQIAPADAPSGLLSVSPAVCNDRGPLSTVDTLVLDRIQDPGNVGSLIRTAVAAGVRQVVLSAGCADPWSPRCLRAGQGAQWLATLYPEVALDDFVESFTGSVAATVLEGGTNLYGHNLTQKTAWLFGNEGQGVSPEIIQMATHRITIPMPGGMESLNVNAAAAVCLFEQVRQRL